MIQLTADKTSFAAPGRPGAPSPAGGLSLFALPGDPAVDLAADLAADLATVSDTTDERQTPAAPGSDLPAAPDPDLLALFIAPVPPAPVPPAPIPSPPGTPAPLPGKAIAAPIAPAGSLAVPSDAALTAAAPGPMPRAADASARPLSTRFPPEPGTTTNPEHPAATPDSLATTPARSPVLTPTLAGEPGAMSLSAPTLLKPVPHPPFSTPASPVTIPAYASPTRPASRLAPRAMAAPGTMALPPQSPLVVTTPGSTATSVQPPIAGFMLPGATLSGPPIDRATPSAGLMVQPPATDGTVPREAAPTPVVAPATASAAALPFRWQIATDAAVAIAAPAPIERAVGLAQPKLDGSAPAPQSLPTAAPPAGTTATLAAATPAMFADIAPVEQRAADDQLAPPTASSGLALAAASPTLAPPAPTTMLDLRQERWPHDMMAQIEVLRDAADAVDTRIRLIPDALGSVDVDVRRDGDTLHVRFSAEQAQTRALLQDAQPRLAEAAEARGLRLGQASVDAGTADQGQQRPPAPHGAPPSRRSAPSPVHAAAQPADDDRIA